MNKHYGLSDPIWQVTNFVVYPPFFENIKLCDSSSTSNNKQCAKSAKTEVTNEDKVCQIIYLSFHREILNSSSTNTTKFCFI